MQAHLETAEHRMLAPADGFKEMPLQKSSLQPDCSSLLTAHVSDDW